MEVIFKKLPPLTDRSMGRIISIANQKGGVGKTTTAVNLSASLAVAEMKTLLVDFDPQGNATSGIGIDKNSLETTIYNALIGEIDLQEAVQGTEIEYLDIAPATIDLIGAEVELIEGQLREQRLRRALDKIKEDYHYIIIDSPPSLGLLTVNALSASDSVLIPLQCEYYAMEGLGQLLNTIKRIKAGWNPGLQVEGILLTMFDARNNLSHQVSEEIRAHFQSQVFDTVIPRNVRLGEAPSHGKPVLLYDIKCKGARSYLELAREVMEKREGNEPWR